MDQVSVSSDASHPAKTLFSPPKLMISFTHTTITKREDGKLTYEMDVCKGLLKNYQTVCVGMISSRHLFSFSDEAGGGLLHPLLSFFSSFSFLLPPLIYLNVWQENKKSTDEDEEDNHDEGKRTGQEREEGERTM